MGGFSQIKLVRSKPHHQNILIQIIPFVLLNRKRKESFNPPLNDTEMKLDLPRLSKNQLASPLKRAYQCIKSKI